MGKFNKKKWTLNSWLVLLGAGTLVAGSAVASTSVVYSNYVSTVFNQEDKLGMKFDFMDSTIVKVRDGKVFNYLGETATIPYGTYLKVQVKKFNMNNPIFDENMKENPEQTHKFALDNYAWELKSQESDMLQDRDPIGSGIVFANGITRLTKHKVYALFRIKNSFDETRNYFEQHIFDGKYKLVVDKVDKKAGIQTTKLIGKVRLRKSDIDVAVKSKSADADVKVAYWDRSNTADAANAQALTMTTQKILGIPVKSTTINPYYSVVRLTTTDNNAFYKSHWYTIKYAQLDIDGYIQGQFNDNADLHTDRLLPFTFLKDDGHNYYYSVDLRDFGDAGPNGQVSSMRFDFNWIKRSFIATEDTAAIASKITGWTK